MAHHRDQAKFDRAQWRLMALVPSWLVQISLYTVLIALSAYLLANAKGVSDEINGAAVAWESISIGFAGVSILCTAFEILRTFAEALTPKEMVVSSLIKLVGIIVSMIMGGLMSDTDLSSWATTTQAIHGVLIIPVLAMGSYAAWIWKCLAQYDDYDHPGNVKPFGFKSDRKEKLLHSHNESADWDVELRGSWASREVVLGNAVDITSPAPTAPSAESAASETRPRGSSFFKVGGRLNFSLTNDVDAANAQASRSRANSSSALLGGSTTVSESQPQSPPSESAEPAIPKRQLSYISVTGTGLDRRASYNHTRDTSFDEYVKQHRAKQSQGSIRYTSGRRSSSAALTRSPAQSTADGTTAQKQQQQQLEFKSDVDDAVGSAFGWGKGSRSSSLDSVMAGGEPPAIAVGCGAVPSAKSVRDSLGRAPSDGSERGALGTMPDDEDDHEGDNGPEGVDEDRRQRKVSEAGRALLGDGDGEFREVPESLRPASGGNTRPRALSETIQFIVTPPPATPTEEGNGGLRKTWGAAYQP
ncbi:hypothetical protein KVR01_012347 [Diaporthe batatas]|uniref:uncharacterized protein n=1 Tax=Diaporthe batatas TaxID=748121 RepID=UPI001D0404FB|nr:uncharacterized protein KVR01_012347 [Diaporthe batatas]KAG8157685.1 hypothetical protein KVR01_012347 [Diaporthe batatas]